MRTNGKKRLALILALGAIFTSSPVAPAQVKGKAKSSPQVAAGGVEPLRVLGGQMRGRAISGPVMAKGRQSNFTFVITKARMVGGKLQLSGDFSLGRSAAAEAVNASIAGTMAKAANPWPGASDDAPEKDDAPKKDEAPKTEQQQGRETKSAEAAAQLGQLAQSTQDTARKTPPAPGERTEQTQSLYAQAGMETGCGIFYLSVEMSPRLRAALGAGPRPVQLGVLLAPIDNRLGEEINRHICAIVRLSGDKPGDARLSESVEEFNRLLASSR
ncbi:MAG TPA: hypothetical protein VNH22_15105 [Blastocatellia bacterium]|jgi:hypothetical protein|nr:hypothetical protein [Blastocatellia bacterium]